MELFSVRVDPLRAVGPVVLGSPRAEAVEALRAWGEPRPSERGLVVFGPGTRLEALVRCVDDRVDAVEVFAQPGAAVVLFGLDVFRTPVADVVAALRTRGDVVEDPGHAVEVPALALALLQEGDGFRWLKVGRTP